MEETVEELILKGSPISGGVAIGHLFFMEEFEEELVQELSIPITEVEKEVRRYRRALHSSRKDLHDLQKFLAKEGSTEAVSIIDTHIQMLEDPFMTTFMEKKIRQRMKNTETVFHSAMVDYEKEFSKVKDAFFKQRLIDVKDLSQRILRNLHPRKSISTEKIPPNSIIFTKELIPSSTAEASKGEVKGFITEIGGTTSHAALIARSKGIPYVANISIDALLPLGDVVVIIDGERGHVIVNPRDETLRGYQEEARGKESAKITAYPSQKIGADQDTDTIEVHANIENLSDMEKLQESGAKGIGLFRTEFLFFGKELESFSEEDQFILYQDVMHKAQGMPVVFRTFDVGGDKGNINLYEPEPNPALGCRGIRFLLKHPEIFANQLKALLRVCPDGDLRILLPLISDLTELIEAKNLIRQVAVELRDEGHEIKDEIPVGCMIEVPSAVILADVLAQECDFLSIGTNDLIQYTLAADRCNQEGQIFYKPYHPSIIRMIKHVVDAAKVYKTPVSLCGEMASDPLMTPLLLGLGVRKLSCATHFIPAIQKMVKEYSHKDLKALTQEVLELDTAQKIESLLLERFG